MKSLRCYLALLASTIFFKNGLFGQNLPHVQNLSVRAPSTIKIDEKLSEWPGLQLSALNPLARIFYVISNDDDYLYLTVHGMGPATGSKILKEGLIFTISYSFNNKNGEIDTNNVSVRFPTTQRATTVSSLMYYSYQANKLYLSNTAKNKMQIDSLTDVMNTRVDQIAKEINIKGIKEIHDSTLSIYNDTGIKARLQFLNGEPVMEMAVPLKYLHFKSTSDSSFTYNISLPSPITPSGFDIHDLMKVGGNASASDDYLYGFTDTNFWGEYTLAKKP
jgi:hypothetical protein